MLEVLALLLPLTPLGLMVWLSDPANAKFRKYVLRQPIVRVTEKSGGWRSSTDSWLTPVWPTGDGKLQGWRYVATKIGTVRLDEATKTGDYHGPVTWEWA